MPPRRSARLVELANPHFQLPFPPDIVALLFSLLPLDTRLRAREVCRGWRFFLEDASWWECVDLGYDCGVNPRFLSDSRLALALLRAACVRAKGNLESLDLSGVSFDDDDPFVLRWLDSAPVADKASLRDLLAPWQSLFVEHVNALCCALPLCRVCCRVYCNAVEALPLLRREPPYELLTVYELLVDDLDSDADDDDGQEVLDLADALARHTEMELFQIHRLRNMRLATRAVDALVDGAISAGITNVHFDECGPTQTALPALARLLQSPDIESLYVTNDDVAMFEGPALPEHGDAQVIDLRSAFCDASRNSKSLQRLWLICVHLWADVAAAGLLIAALEGHPSLLKLELSKNRTDGTPATQRAVGECLARLIARSSRLRTLCLDDNRLGEAGMAPIFEALRCTSTLTELSLRGEQFSLDFVRDVVLPAVRASTSLRNLESVNLVDAEEDEEELLPELREVEGILEARRLADEESA